MLRNGSFLISPTFACKSSCDWLSDGQLKASSGLKGSFVFVSIQIEETVTALPSKPQYMMFSATIPETIEKLASRMMVNPIYISVGLSGAPSPSIKQIVLWVEDKSKKKKLFSIIDDRKHFLAPALVFVDSKIGADMLSDAINEVCYLLHTNIRCKYY